MKRRKSPTRRRALALLRLVVASLRRSASLVERRTGVTNAQLFLLQQIEESGPLTVNGLAARARTDHSTVSTIARRLVSAGLARKNQSKSDGRSVVVSLTASGRRVVRNAPAPPTASVLRALEQMPEADVRALARGLHALAHRLEAAPGAPAMLFEEAKPRRRTKPTR